MKILNHSYVFYSSYLDRTPVLDIYPFVGCLKLKDGNDLNGAQFEDNGMTISKCQAFCSKLNYDYFALSGKKCSCDDNYTSLGRTENSCDCNTKCGGDYKQVCRGAAAVGEAGSTKKHSIYKLMCK